MERKHTKGPWRIDPHHRYDVQTEDGQLEISTTYEKVLVGGIKPNLLEQEANARLIAAAPDLLEALQAVVRVADRSTVEFDAARAAIAKATGSRA